jgi:hypothetical protein
MKQLGGWGENKPNKKKFPKQTFTLGFFFFVDWRNVTNYHKTPNFPLFF